MPSRQRKVTFDDDLWFDTHKEAKALNYKFYSHYITYLIDYAREELNIAIKTENPKMMRLREIDREIGKSAKRVGDIHFTITSVAGKLQKERENIDKLIKAGLYTPEKGEEKFELLKTEYMKNMERQEEREQILKELEEESIPNYSDKDKKKKRTKKKKKHGLVEWIMRKQEEFYLDDGESWTHSELNNMSIDRLKGIKEEWSND